MNDRGEGKMQKIIINENRGFGVYATDAGEFLVSYAMNGVDSVLQNTGSGATEYLITGYERDADGSLTGFQVEKFKLEEVEGPNSKG